MGSHLEKEQARLRHLADGRGELVRPLTQALQLSLDRGELLQDIGCVHGIASEVVGDAVQGVGGLVLLVVPLVELAVEAVCAGEVEHHVALRCDVLRRQLQEQPHERGRGDAQSVASVCARSTSASLTRTCRCLSNLSTVPP